MNNKEILLGVAAGVAIFLALMGINIMPIILTGGIFVALLYMLKSQGGMTVSVGKAIESDIVNTTFDDIGGQATAVQELKEALDFLIAEKDIQNMGIRPLKGILLTGPPGTGKTMLARAAAGYTGSAFVAAAGSEFIEMYAGVGAKRVRQLFAQARRQALAQGKKSAIVFIDELEVMAARRGSQHGHLEYDQTLNQLLVEMDGLRVDDEVRILVIGATNRHDLIDQALLRPGRFDRQVKVDLPDREGRASILRLHTRNKPLASNVDLNEVAANTFGFSGADLEAVTNEAAILAWRDRSPVIKQKHLLEAVEKVILGERSGKRLDKEERLRVAVHESGHAVVSEMLEKGSVSTITIVPRGQAMGYMRPAEKQDRYLYTARYLKNQIAVALAGAMAEYLWFGDFSTGARNDFEKAWEWSKEMVKSGYSALGIIGISDIPGEKLFAECAGILSRCREETLELLKGKQEILRLTVELLLERETLKRVEWEELLAG